MFGIDYSDINKLNMSIGIALIFAAYFVILTAILTSYNATSELSELVITAPCKDFSSPTKESCVQILVQRMDAITSTLRMLKIGCSVVAGVGALFFSIGYSFYVINHFRMKRAEKVLVRK